MGRLVHSTVVGVCTHTKKTIGPLKQRCSKGELTGNALDILNVAAKTGVKHCGVYIARVYIIVLYIEGFYLLGARGRTALH